MSRGKQRTIGGTYDLAGANRAIDTIREESLYGTLTITDGLQDLSAFFTRGGLRLLASGRPLPTLRQQLVARGKLTPEAAREIDAALAQARLGQGDKQLDERELLLTSHGFKAPDLDGCAADVALETLAGALLWDSADFELRTGEPDREVMTRRDLPALTLSVGVDKLLERLKSRLRVVKDVRQTVPSLRATVAPTAAGRELVESGKPLGNSPEERAQTRLLRKIVEEPGSSVRHLALRLLMGELALADRLQPLREKGLVEVVRAAVDKRAELARLREMEAGLDQALNQLLRRVAVAKTAAAQGDGQGAARHMARAGGLLLQSGRSDEAARSFEEALGHADDNLEAREGFVQSLWATGREEEAARQSDELGRRYLELNLPGRARRVLERALGFREETSTLELLVNSLVKLDRSAAAAEAGERLINRLRREGRLDEARGLADKLMATGDQEARERLSRAAGVDRVKVAILIGAGVLLGGAIFYLQGVNGVRDAYRTRSQAATAALAASKSLEDYERAVQGALKDLGAMAQQEDEVGAHAAQVVQRLERIQADCHLARQLGPLLPWKNYHDVDELSARVQDLARGIRSAALNGPVVQLKGEMRAYQQSFEKRRQELQERSVGELSTEQLLELFKLAKSIREDFRGLPQRLARAYAPIRIETTPPGATVTVDGTRYQTKTPLTLNLGLRGPLELGLELERFEPLRGELVFDTLESPIVARELTPAEGEGEEERDLSKVQVVLSQGLTKGQLTRRYSRISLAKDSRYFAGVSLGRLYRGRVQTINEIQADRVFLVGLRVTLWAWKGRTWVAAPAREVEVPRTERPTRALGTVLHVEPLSATRGLNAAALQTLVQETLQAQIEQLGGER